MKRLVFAIAAGAVLLAACGGGDSVAATVNGEEIMSSEIEGFVHEPTDFDKTPQQFAAYLGQTIQWLAVEQRVIGELGFEPAQDDIDTEVRRVVINAGFLDLPTFLVQQNIAESTLERVAKHLVIQRHLHDMLGPDIEPPTDDEVQQELDENAERWVSEVCASHILVTTVGEAEAALERLDAGEEFADLAAELSQDTSNAADGGSLGCADPDGYVPEFAQATTTAPIGEVTGPVQTQFGAHLILVESRETTPFEEVRDALTDLRTVEAVSEWLADTVKAAAVTVDESRGTWITEPEPLVQPPAELG